MKNRTYGLLANAHAGQIVGFVVVLVWGCLFDGFFKETISLRVIGFFNMNNVPALLRVHPKKSNL